MAKARASSSVMTGPPDCSDCIIYLVFRNNAMPLQDHEKLKEPRGARGSAYWRLLYVGKNRSDNGTKLRPRQNCQSIGR
jgi:hypothetical protein